MPNENFNSDEILNEISKGLNIGSNGSGTFAGETIGRGSAAGFNTEAIMRLAASQIAANVAANQPVNQQEQPVQHQEQNQNKSSS